MAEILIFNDRTESRDPLRYSLESGHNLHHVPTIKDALKLLHHKPVDLIISHSHLEHSSVFEFIKCIKQEHRLNSIPIICFNGRESEISRFLDMYLKRSTLLIGAAAYISLKDFGGTAHCDILGLRRAVEVCLSAL